MFVAGDVISTTNPEFHDHISRETAVGPTSDQLSPPSAAVQQHGHCSGCPAGIAEHLAITDPDGDTAVASGVEVTFQVGPSVVGALVA
jgi:hypothetical protein